MYNAISSGSAGALSLLCLKACRPSPIVFLQRTISFSPPNFGSNSNSKSTKKNLTYYEILGIEKSASPANVRSAFLRLSKTFHPDVNAKDPQNHEKFVEINEAYSVLSKPLKRREYDNVLMYNIKRRDPNPNSPGPYPTPPYGREAPHYSSQRNAYYDPQFYHNRDKSQDAYYSSKPYYGFDGVSKKSNKTVAYLLLAFLVIGAAFHFFIVNLFTNFHIENLNARDKRNHEMLKKGQDPEYYANQQIQSTKIRIKEKEEEKKSKDN